MKSSIIFTFLFLVCINAHAKCEWNTDLHGGFEPTWVWKRLSPDPDCKISKMNLSDYFNSRNDIEVIVFNYQADPGHHGIEKSTIGICYRDVVTNVVVCKKEI